jgi:hypothetical protein
LKCKRCGKIHTELPGCIHPYKQYLVEVIEPCLDNDIKACPSDERTIRRWQHHWHQLKPYVNGLLKSLWGIQHQRHYPLLGADSLLDAIRNKGPGWLTLVNQFVFSKTLGLPT